jgi:hypothetical protein
MRNSIDMLAKLQTSLFENEIDTIVSIGSKITLELQDMKSKSIIAVVTGDTLEDAYANLLGTLANYTRAVKNYT